MQVSVESTSAIERRMTIGVPAERFESEVNKRLQRTAKQARIPGFRPGKAPMNIIRQRYEAGVREEVMNDVIGSSYFEALQEQKLNPAGTPTIEPKVFEKDKDFEFVATFEVYPEFEVSGLDSIEIERLQAEVTDGDIDNMIDVLRKQNTRYAEVERSAENGDQVNIDFVGKLDGEVFAGGSAEGFDLVLGSGNMIPGFEEPLIGSKAGDEKVVTPTFPENYQNLDLAGKKAEFTVKINAVKAPTEPELDDEFFALFGHTEGGLEAFREEIKKNMQRELKAALKNKVKTQAFDALLENNKIELPKAPVEADINSLRQQAVQQFGGNINPEQLPADMFAAQAERRVALGLIVGQMIKQFDIKVEDDAVRAVVEEMAAAYQEPQQVIDWYYKNDKQLEEVRASVLEDQVVEHILGKAKVADKQVSYDEAVKPAAAVADKQEAED